MRENLSDKGVGAENVLESLGDQMPDGSRPVEIVQAKRLGRIVPLVRWRNGHARTLKR
jgi:hypothetical protein